MVVHPSFAALTTPREREVLALVLEGFTSAEISDQLGISARTVEVHRRKMLHVARARNPIELYIAATTGRAGRAERAIAKRIRRTL